MIYNAPTKGEDGLYFVKVLNDDKRKSLIQLNKIKVTDVSGEITMDLGSEVNTQKIETIDAANLEAALENCESWFGKKVSDGVIKGAYTSSLDAGSMTCDRIDATRVFNTQQEPIDFDTVQPDKTCDVILEFAGIWFAKKSFGSSWNIVQVKVHPAPVLDTYPDGY